MIEQEPQEQWLPVEAEPTVNPVEATGGAGDAAAKPAPATPTSLPFHPAPFYQKIIPFALAAFLLGADQLSKSLIIARLDVYESYAPIPALDWLFQFTHIHNTGAAFGMFPTGGLFFTAIAIIVAIAIVIYTRKLDAGHYLLRIALGMQLGGALGNLVDRLRLGYVTDFIDVVPFPAIFNIADASIVGGVVVLFYLMLLETIEEQRQKKQQSDSPTYEFHSGETTITPEERASSVPHDSTPYVSVND